MSDETTLYTVGLEKLLKALKTSNVPTARVGIIGAKAGPHYVSVGAGKSAPAKIPTNAEVGAVHEFGSPTRGIPQRSFLRMPLIKLLSPCLEAEGATSEAELQEVIKQGSVKPWLEKVAIIAERIVQGAFGSNGYGEWAAWKKPGYTNNTGMILVDTTQLRNSITSEVK